MMQEFVDQINKSARSATEDMLPVSSQRVMWSSESPI